MDVFLQLLIFGGLFFFMMKFGCGSHMMGHGKGHGKDTKTTAGCCGGSDKNKTKQSTQPPKNDVDPVCGKSVTTDMAKTSLHDGLIYFFCSPACREIFEEDPGRYAANDKQSSPALLEH